LINNGYELERIRVSPELGRQEYRFVVHMTGTQEGQKDQFLTGDLNQLTKVQPEGNFVLSMDDFIA
jgi:hypothetical protein